MISIVILTLLLISFVTIFMTGRAIGTYGSVAVALLNLALALVVLVFGWLSSGVMSVAKLWDWLAIGSETLVGFTVRCDEYTLGMFMVVLVVSSLVHLYSAVYMYTDPFLSRFISYLTLFTLFMLILVSADNFVVLFLGWEGVGVCSYLLISFWYTRYQAAKAATKAFIINKIGDVFLLLGISGVFCLFGVSDFSSTFTILPYSDHPIYGVLVMCLFIGVVGKSAQIGLHTWLPDAMEGPTPVSALIHAATMVTAGVFLMIRAAPFFDQVPDFLFVAAAWGAITALFSGIIGLAQNDIKKIIAYSTCSQLGYMVLACGFSQYSLAFFHLFNHAFFKACLFLSAGSVIHILMGEQDTRKMGGLASRTPLVYVAVVVASLSLMGVSFLSGFYSKDAIIEISFMQVFFGSGVLFWAALLSALLTAAYSLKLLYNAFIGTGFNGFKSSVLANQGATVVEALVLWVLALGGVFSGFVFKDAFLGFGNPFLGLAGGGLSTLSSLELELISPTIKALPLAGSVLASLAYLSMLNGGLINRSVAVLESLRFYYNEVSNYYIGLPILVSARHVFEGWEKCVLENYGPLGMMNVLRRVVNKQ